MDSACKSFQSSFIESVPVTLYTKKVKFITLMNSLGITNNKQDLFFLALI